MSEYILPHVDGYLKLGQDYDCSDIHLAVNSRPTWRRFGQLLPIWEEAPNLTPQDTEVLARGFLEDPEWNRLQQRGDVDFAYANDFGRYRASVVKQRLGYDICFRIINTRVRTMEEIGLPTEYVVPLTRYTNGLILVTGSVGSGKSTTLAAIIDYINSNQARHIITVEEPIEFVHPNKKSIVTQREVPLQTPSFADGLRASLREDSDIVLVGEMRDLETISLALTAAETGHLVLGTLHTGSAARTVDRVLDVFPVEQRDQIRIMVSESLRGIISQQLVPRADGNGRAQAIEMHPRRQDIHDSRLHSNRESPGHDPDGRLAPGSAPGGPHHHGRLHLPRGRQNHHEILPGNQVTFNFETLLLWLSSTNTSNTS